jgi:hypothetical protein
MRVCARAAGYYVDEQTPYPKSPELSERRASLSPAKTIIDKFLTKRSIQADVRSGFLIEIRVTISYSCEAFSEFRLNDYLSPEPTM